MLVRSIDKNNYSMRVYRGYAGSGTSTIDWNGGYKYLVQYGCGFNFKVVQGDDDSGTYINQAFTYTQIPVDRNEWYFIVANFKPSVDENAFSPGNCSYVADFV